MKGKHAVAALLTVSVLVAALLLMGSITPVVAGGVFAAALALLGVLSGGFRK
ncbi:MAG: hypothetical protein AABY89_07880 [Acidobacteriota bacterium]